MFPTLNPLALQAAVSLPSARLTGQPFDALSLLGRVVLRLMVGIDKYVERPYDDARLLKTKMQDSESRPWLCSLMRDSPLREIASTRPLRLRSWQPPGVECRPGAVTLDSSQVPQSEDVSACMLEATLGAFFLAEGGGFFSAWQLWRWLQRPDSSSGLNESPDPVMGHYAFGSYQHFLGRTPSYTEFQEVVCEGESTRTLRVYFEERGWAEYRRPVASGDAGRKRAPMERMADVRGGEWKALRYNPQLHTFVSAWMMNEDGTHRPLPNKVTSWIRGKPVASLTIVKHYMGRTPDYVQLREKLDGQLWVRYREDGWMCYMRNGDEGGIGMEYRFISEPGGPGEPQLSKGQPLKYSERLKMLKSFTMDEPLPNKVVEWLRLKSLALLAVPRKSDGDEAATTQKTELPPPKRQVA